MKFIPHPYQRLMIDHALETPRGALWAGMGMGKTVATLTALDALRLAVDGPALVLAPLRVAQSTWPDEQRRWDHLSGLGDVAPVVGNLVERKRALKRDAAVYTTNYEQLPWLVAELGDRWPFSVVVPDESTRLKGFRLRQGTQRAKALGKVAHGVERWVNLTGTPAPNGLMDLWGQTWFLDRGERLGRTYDAFKTRWFFKTQHETTEGKSFPRYEPHIHAQGEIQHRLQDICLSLEPKDWFDLDEPIVKPVYVELPAKARTIYRDMERKMFAEIAEVGVEALNAASKTLKCLQIASGAAYLDDTGAWGEIHDQKLQALESIVEEAAGAPVLVAYHFKSDLARLVRNFPRGRVLDKDPSVIADWNKGKIPLLFAHPASAGHGISLQHGGNILAFFSHWWNAEERAQIIERIGPMRQKQSGYDRPVYVYNIIARDTVDELVIDRHVSKRSVQDLLMSAMKRKGLL